LTVELADTSAWTNRLLRDAVRAEFDARLLAGEIAMCPPVKLELLWTARNSTEFDGLAALAEGLPQVEVGTPVWDRTVAVWRELVRRGRHRQVPRNDLIVAAAAELAGMPVCHYDRHFEVIAEVTGQPVRAIAPLGTL
jgi:predicted nucleic acid-binding protein